MLKSAGRGIWILGLAFLALPTVRSQVLYGSLVGSVTDPAGSAVPNAAISVTNAETNTARATVADDAGRYTLSNLLPGSYLIEVTSTGFKKFASRNNRVQINSITRVDVQLVLGGVTESVTISADAAALQTDKTDVNATIARATARKPNADCRDRSSFSVTPQASLIANCDYCIARRWPHRFHNMTGRSGSSFTSRRSGGKCTRAMWLP